MQAPTTSHKRLALAIIDFLGTSVRDGTLTSEDADSIEIAQNCIAEAFKVDPADTAAHKDAVGDKNLLQIYGVYEKMKSAGAAGGGGPAGVGASTNDGAGTTNPRGQDMDEGKKKEEAEKLKAQGNAAMAKKDYNSAVEQYTKALELVPLNPIYLSNRAAAYSGAHKHAEAKDDAEMAVAADPKYTKAWSRLGLARFALGDAKGSMEAYQKGIEAEGSGGSDAMKKGYETAKKRYLEEGGSLEDAEEATAATRDAPGAGAGFGAGAGGMPDLSSLMGMLGGGGAGGGGGGMPDLSQLGSMMNNPMFRQMAQNVMSNPEMLQGMMNNPRVREMADRFGGGGAGGQGGGMPDLSAMMNDPNIAEM